MAAVRGNVPGAGVSLSVVPVSLAEAKAYVERHHRHHPAPVGAKFCVAVAAAGEIRGVAIVGRPVARGFDDGWTVEVSRCCTDGAKNAASMLYGAAWRAARALGYRRLVTYTLASEPGTSLRAAGFRVLHEVKGRSWSCETRPRVDRHPTLDKLCWQVGA